MRCDHSGDGLQHVADQEHLRDRHWKPETAAHPLLHNSRRWNHFKSETWTSQDIFYLLQIRLLLSALTLPGLVLQPDNDDEESKSLLQTKYSFHQPALRLHICRSCFPTQHSPAAERFSHPVSPAYLESIFPGLEDGHAMCGNCTNYVRRNVVFSCKDQNLPWTDFEFSKAYGAKIKYKMTKFSEISIIQC